VRIILTRAAPQPFTEASDTGGVRRHPGRRRVLAGPNRDPLTIASTSSDAGRPSAWRAVAAATVLNAPLGSLYAFSVFLKPLEALLDLSRADLALVFAVASAGFGGGMNLAPYVFGLAAAPVLVLGCAAASTLGIALAATAGGLVQLAIGYGVLFGAGGGAAYVLVQQAVNLAVTGRRGLVNGYIVSLFPAGAMIAAPLFGWSVREFGVRATLGGLAGVLAATGMLSAWLIARSRVTLSEAAGGAAPAEDERRRAVFWRLWIVFFLAASAGLMVLSQAAGIIAAYGGAAGLAVYGTTFIAGCIAAARIGGGWMTDWLTIPTVAAGAHAIALAGNAALTLWPGPAMSVLALTLVGLGYGVISGVTAAAVAVYWRRALYGRVAGRLYLAWCAAAIVLPIAAGRLYDLTQGYGTAVLIAAAGNVAGVLVALGLPGQRASREESEAAAPADPARRPTAR
jgi:OFA family oxalate/formate antiporter-like MFS transporter